MAYRFRGKFADGEQEAFSGVAPGDTLTDAFRVFLEGANRSNVASRKFARVAFVATDAAVGFKVRKPRGDSASSARKRKK